MGGIGYVNPWALWLTAGAAAPLIIHLLMRQRPRTVKYPLIRLIRRSQLQVSRRNRLRHLLLLLLRMALIALFALIIARPVPESDLDAVGAGGRPGQRTAAAVLILDDSMSMRYRVGDVTWFDVARHRAGEVLEMLHPGTAIGVLTTSPMSGKLVAELGTAGEQIEQARPGAGSSDCWGALENAAELLRQDFAGRAVFLFTDMTRTAWPDYERRRLDMGGQVDLFLVDCAGDAGGNGAIYELSHEGEPALVGAELALKARVIASRAPIERTVEFEFDGSPVARHDVRLGAGEETTLRFSLLLSKAGHHRGRVAFLNPDALATDDARTFTVDVAAEVRALVIEDAPGSGIESPSYFLRLALNPWDDPERGVFRVERASPDRLSSLDADPPDLVVLAGAGGMTDAGWEALERYVGRGGGLLVFLGPEAGEAYRSEAARLVLGVGVGHAQPAPPQSPLRLRVVGRQSPVAVGLARAGADLGGMSFSQFQELEPDERAEPVLSFGQGAPALLISRQGGRVAVFAGPADDRWGEFATVPAFVPLCHELAFYLTDRVAGGIADSTVGEDVLVTYEPSRWPTTISVIAPGAQEGERLAAGATEGRAVYRKADAPGYYTTEFECGSRIWAAGFAVNVVPEESRLERVPVAKLKEALRARRVEVVTDVSDIDLDADGPVVRARELTPFICVLALVLMAAESFLANRFYREAARPSSEAAEAEAS